MKLPKVPMAPIIRDDLPTGDDWVYQLKWDGVRTLARLDGTGGVELFSKRVGEKNAVYPEIVELLQELRIGPCVLDGEICHFDGLRPNFQRIKIGATKKRDESLIYVVFDLLYDNGEDIRSLPLIDRYTRLQKLLSEPQPRLFVTDNFDDGEALWEWVSQREWEGIVCKRKDGPYVDGKAHKSWYKKRKQIKLTVDVVGVKLSGGYVSSLMLRYQGKYIGHVSGLSNESKRIIMEFARANPGDNPFNFKPKYYVLWLSIPFTVKVAALEFTDSGQLRHPKLIGFGDN